MVASWFRLSGLSFVGVLFSCNVLASDFTVQIGAFKQLGTGFTEAAEEFGPVTRRINDVGITVVSVGSYATRDAAERALGALVADYPDAFVRSTTTIAPPANTLAATAQDNARWSQLPPEDRKNVVYLDGKLHIKRGDEFIPLADYPPQR